MDSFAIPSGLSALLETSLPLSVADLSLPDEPLVAANDAFYELSGLTPGEIIGRNCRFMQGPETDPDTVRRLRTAVKNREVCRVQLVNYRRDGSSFLNELMLMPFDTADVPGRYMIGMQRDVTASEALRAGRASFRFRRNGRSALAFEALIGSVRSLLGIEDEALRRDGAAFFEAMPELQRDRVDRALRKSIAQRRPLSIDFPALTKSGPPRWLRLEVRHDGSAAPGLLAGSLTDVTRETALVGRLRLLESIVQNANDAILVTEAEPYLHPGPKIIYASPAIERHTGWKPEELIGATPRVLQGPETSERTRAEIREALTNWRPFQTELVNYRRDQQKMWNEISFVPVADDSGWYVYWVSIQRDVTERKEREERIFHLAHHDTVTRLPNRALCRDRLDSALKLARREDRRIAVMQVDLDRFKSVNDRMGHPAGDALLLEASLRMRRGLRASDTLARVGGDEFMVVLPDCESVASASMVAEKIVASLSEPFILREGVAEIGASVGVTIYPDDGTGADTLLVNADLALYRAKENRGSVAFFSAQMRREVQDRNQLEQELRAALDRDELEIHFQPQVAVETGAVAGVEALLRWRHPSRGLLLPDSFLPTAAESRLMEPIGRRVLHEAATAARAWTALGLRPPVIAVNVDGAQLKNERFAPEFVRLLSEFDVAPQSFAIEIVETVLLDRLSETIIANLEELHRRRVGIELDDFGTGFASLTHLRRIPVDRIKIDRSFVSDIATDPNDAAIVRAIIALGHSLGICVIAEGVETEEQKDFLRINGCDQLQGYVVARPMPFDETTAWLRAHARSEADAVSEIACFDAVLPG